VILNKIRAISIKQLTFQKFPNISTIFVALKRWKCHLYYSQCSQSQTESRSLYMPLFDQLIHNALMECSPSLKQMLLQL